ncbi:MAG TPA: hypothetical protein VFK86_05810 [Bauldia sp.]|nr:hypothetical protein [Bauldia sp.]
MNDFYSVLRQTIIDRGLSSASAREEAYAQARQAMINRLWSYDPPLAEDEIDLRIGQFDTAVARIEDDVVEVFAAMAPAEERQARSADSAYGEDADDGRAPALGGTLGDPPESEDEALPELNAVRSALRALDERSLAVERALRAEEDDQDYDAAPAEPAPYDEDIAGWTGDDAAAAEQESAAIDETAARARTERQPVRRPPVPKPRRSARPLTRPKPVSGIVSRFVPKTEAARLRALAAAVAVLTLLLVAGVVWLFLPSSTVRTGNPVVLNTEVPGGVSDPDTAIRLPKEAIAVTRSFTLFDGNDPTVFAGDPDNPVRFDGELARIATSVASAGAKVVIGAGLSSRLAGKTVRVTIDARSARENGASSMRFAYQSGVAISHWQTANLSSEFTPLGLVWRVPAMRTNPSGDYIVIEPGIPGSGTGVEIRSVTIDLVDEG